MTGRLIMVSDKREMKQLLYTLLAAVFCVAACHSVESSEALVAEDDVLYACIEEGEMTRASLNEAGNVLWSEGDRIVAFVGTSYGESYQVKPSFVGKNYADFVRISSVGSETLPNETEWGHVVAYYPYGDDVECAKSANGYSLSVVLPSEQEYASASFGNNSWPMVAVSETNRVTFRNVCGGMLLQLKGTHKVSSITVQGKNKEKLAGSATVTAYADGSTPTITMAGDASAIVVLNCSEDGIQLTQTKSTEFIITLPPTEFTKGFKVTVTDDKGQEHIIETDKSNSVNRSNLLVMPVVDLDVPNYPGCPYINKAVFFGDSIMHGVYSYYEESADGKILRKNGFDSNSNTHLRIPDYFGLYADAEVTNNGCTGTTIQFILEHFDTLVSDTDDLVICTIGTNNRHRGKDLGDAPSREEWGKVFYDAVLQLNEKFEERDIPVIFVANLPAAQSNEVDGETYYRILHMDDINEIYKRARKAAGFALVSMYDLVTDYVNEKGILVDALLCDGLHPSDEGYKVMFSLLCEALGA